MGSAMATKRSRRRARARKSLNRRESKNWNEIADALRDEIKSRGLRQIDIQKETGVSQPSISRFMSGKGGLDVASFVDIVKFLGGTIEL